MIDLSLVNFWLFGTIAFMFFAMCGVIASVRDGKLKWYLVAFLFSLGLASTLRMLTRQLTGVITPDGLGIAVGMPVLMAQIAMTAYWIRTHYLRK